MLRLVTFAPNKAVARVVSARCERTGGWSISRRPICRASLVQGWSRSSRKGRRPSRPRGGAAAAGDGPQVETVHLLAPIPAPTRNIYAVGWNYLEHFAEGQATSLAKTEYPAHPGVLHQRCEHDQRPLRPDSLRHRGLDQIDWEAELAIIVGKGGRNIKEADALDHVFGYSIMNDTTARDMQRTLHGGQWFKGKSLDGHGPFGPWIVPASDIDPSNLRLLLRVNGVVKQDASTQQMYFKVARIISELSHGLTLVPGDIIATGTPPGVGFARKPPNS